MLTSPNIVFEEFEQTHFCIRIFKRFYNSDESDQQYGRMSSRIEEESLKIKREVSKTPDFAKLQKFDSKTKFLTDVAHELRVQYVVIMLDDSQFTSKNRKLMAEIFKSLSTLGIRLSVELVKSDLKNVLKVVPVTSADRPCMFFIMGEGGRIVQKVRLVHVSHV